MERVATKRFALSLSSRPCLHQSFSFSRSNTVAAEKLCSIQRCLADVNILLTALKLLLLLLLYAGNGGVLSVHVHASKLYEFSAELQPALTCGLPNTVV